MVKIEASILSADYARLGEQVREAEAAGVDGIQVDVMDGRFVPNITFGPGVVRALRPLMSGTLDVDLMVAEPERHLAAFADAGADRLTVHLEACLHPHQVLQLIHELGVQAGVAISPGTSLSGFEELLGVVDLIQIMTVNPGWGGQAFLHSVLPKMRRLRRMLDEQGLAAELEVDGGITAETAPLVVEAGARVLVAGSAVFQSTEGVAAAMERIGESVRKVRPAV